MLYTIPKPNHFKGTSGDSNANANANVSWVSNIKVLGHTTLITLINASQYPIIRSPYAILCNGHSCFLPNHSAMHAW
jgi:hypothetical protein